jgi:hypothetical protein
VLNKSNTFFEVDHVKLTESQKQMFIIVDEPYKTSRTPNKFEWPEVRKLETYLKESCLIIEQTRLFFEEVKALYDTEDQIIFEWISEEAQTVYLLKACQTQSIGTYTNNKHYL